MVCLNSLSYGAVVLVCLGLLSVSVIAFVPRLDRSLPLTSASFAKQDDDVDDDVGGLMSPFVHHSAVRTRNITTAIQFYSLLGFEVDCRFRAGPARAAWLSLMAKNTTTTRTTIASPTAAAARLELIEVPPYILNEPAGMRRRAPNLMENQVELGWNHMAIDVTAQIKGTSSSNNMQDLADWMAQLNETSMQTFGKSLRVAVPPRQQMIGRNVFELAFIYDADGCLIEFLHKQGQVQSQSMDSGWDPWDGEGFVGISSSSSS